MWAAIGSSAVSLVGGALLNKKSTDAATRANDAASRAANTQAAIAQDQWDTYKSTYQPMEKAYVEDAQTYDNPLNIERAAGEASATVASQYGKARDRLSRTPGLDPSSAAFNSAMVGLDMNQAAADAVSQNAARNKVKDMAWARRTDALSLGKGLPAQASAGLAQTAMTNTNLAAGLNNQANATGAGFGKLVSNGLNAWMKNSGSGGGGGSDGSNPTFQAYDLPND